VRLILTPRSVRDLDQIREYITQESGSREAADKFLGRLLDRCNALAVLPNRYPPYRFADKWRMAPVENYLILFQIQNGEVRIGHIRHSAKKPFRG
jgi:plasmid stabilization system protein ParE